jgi:thiol:disulfide interchange protein DsbD
MLKFFLCLLLVLPSLLWADYLEFPHSQARVVVDHQSISKEDGRFWVGLEIKLDPDWHTYWENPGDSGAKLIYSLSADHALVKVGDVQWPVPKRIDVEPLTSFAYEESVTLAFPVDVSSIDQTKSKLNFKLDAEWLVCKVECVPAFGEFSFSVKLEGRKSSHEGSFSALSSTWPQPNVLMVQHTQKSDQVLIDLSKISEQVIDFFPSSGQSVDNDVETRASNQIVIKAEGGARLVKLEGLAVSRSGKAFWVDSKEQTSSVWSFILFAFLGGLILNLMPCVLPILSLKLFSFLQSRSKSLLAIRLESLAYAAGVVFSFLAVALLLIFLRTQGQSIGWGFQLQSPIFLICMILIFSALSLNFLDVYTINLPGMNVGAQLSQRKSLLGAFMTGVLSVLVASPCTAPFMGVAMGFALSQGTSLVLLVFLALSLGFSFPFLLFAVMPKSAQWLPKPGVWMLWLKKILFIPLLGTVLWLCWVLGRVQGSLAFYGAVASVVLLMFGISLYFKRHKGVLSKSIIFLSFVFSVGTLFTESAPFKTEESILDWSPFNASEVNRLAGAGRPLFVNFTADWCLSCKVNEKVVFNNKDVVKKLEDMQVLLFKADWTEKDPSIAQELEKYGRFSVPFYLFYEKDNSTANILPELLTPEIFIKQLEGIE